MIREDISILPPSRVMTMKKCCMRTIIDWVEDDPKGKFELGNTQIQCPTCRQWMRIDNQGVLRWDEPTI